MDSLGEVLRRNRESQGLTLEQVSEATHISVSYLQALENEQMDAFPADVYARGFLRSYASFLGLDAVPLLERFQALRSPPPSETTGPRRRQGRASTAPAAGRAARSQRDRPASAAGPPLDEDSSADLAGAAPSLARRTARTQRTSSPERRLPSSGSLFPYSDDRPAKGPWAALILIVLLLALAATWLFGPLHGLRSLRAMGSHFLSRPSKKQPAARPHPAKVHRVPEVPHATPRPDAPLTLVLQSTGWVFIQVTSDYGKERVYQGEWYPGLQKTWWGRKRIDVYADRGNNILATFNGKQIGRLAVRRQRVWRSFPPANPPTPTSEAAGPATTGGAVSSPMGSSSAGGAAAPAAGSTSAGTVPQAMPGP